MDSPSRRLRRYRFSPEALGELFVTGMTVKTVDGIPSDAEIRGGGFDLISNTFVLYVEHCSFAEAPRGEMLPEGEIRVQKIQDNKGLDIGGHTSEGERLR